MVRNLMILNGWFLKPARCCMQN